MYSYHDLRDDLILQLKTDHGLNIRTEFSNYTWDDLPEGPCDSSCVQQFRKTRLRRDAGAPPLDSPAVLYLPLGGGGGGGCPSLAESSVVGISQMVFLWTVMSVFNVVANVVANINNNQNNRNNNNNNLQINKISTQNTQISANTNNANTITIMLPPPIPVLAGGRQIDAKKRLKRFVERERKLEARKNGKTEDDISRDKPEFFTVASHILRYVVSNDQQTSRECLGRQLCHLSRDVDRYEASAAFKIIAFALMWIELEDRSQSFVEFLDSVISRDIDQTLDCDLIFYRCETDNPYTTHQVPGNSVAQPVDPSRLLTWT